MRKCKAMRTCDSSAQLDVLGLIGSTALLESTHALTLSRSGGAARAAHSRTLLASCSAAMHQQCALAEPHDLWLVVQVRRLTQRMLWLKLSPLWQCKYPVCLLHDCHDTAGLAVELALCLPHAVLCCFHHQCALASPDVSWLVGQLRCLTQHMPWLAIPPLGRRTAALCLARALLGFQALHLE